MKCGKIFAPKPSIGSNTETDKITIFDVGDLAEIEGEVVVFVSVAEGIQIDMIGVVNYELRSESRSVPVILIEVCDGLSLSLV